MRGRGNLGGLGERIKSYMPSARKAIQYGSLGLVSTGVLATAAIYGATQMAHTAGETEVGVRTVNIGLERGIEQKAYSPGTHFFVPVLNDWHTLDTAMVTLNMSGQDALSFKSAEGNDIHLDLSISYRVDPNKAPYIIGHVAQSDEELQSKVVRAASRAKPRDVFGELTTEQFYNAQQRTQASLRAKSSLNEILGQYGVIVEGVELRDYRWGNTEFGKAIKDEQLATREASRLEQAVIAQRQENLRLLEDANKYGAKIRAEADGAYDKAVAKADAAFTRQESVARAIRAEGDSEAAGIAAERKAIISGGGKALVAMEYLRNLQGADIVMYPSGEGAVGINTLDVNQFLATTMAASKAHTPQAPVVPQTPEPTQPPKQ